MRIITSIVIKAEDRYSDTVKRMSTYTKSFSKDLDALENDLYSLGKNKTQLKIDAKQALQALKDAEKQFLATGNAADGLQLEMAQANYDNVKRNLDAVTKAARDTEKQIQKVQTASEKQMNGIAGSSNSMKGVAVAVLASAATNYFAPLVQDIFSSVAVSGLGSSNGSIASSALTSAISGAAMGSMISPGLGTAIGAAVGGGIGLVSGVAQNESNKDEYFKSYVQEAVEGQISELESTLTSGSATAGSREQTRIAFAQRFGSESAADDYLEQVKTMAVNTNYGYDEIVGYSKLLLNTYNPEDTLSVLGKLSDATAGLNLSSSDIEVMIAGLSRMRTTGKATQEYLNYFSERGVDVYAALSNATGADKSQISEMVTKGQISGDTAAQAILDYIDDTFGGLSEKLASTYDAMVDNLADAQANIDAAMGEGYNEARKEGIQAQQDWLSGESGAMVEEAYKSIGAFQAELENQKEALVRQYMDEAMTSDEYKTAEAEGDAATMGRLIMEAKVKAQNEYNASEGAQLMMESEKAMIASVRDDTSTNQSYWDAGYQLGQEFSKGRMAGMSANWTGENDGNIVVTGKTFHYGSSGGYATGLERVPYNNFPALLHEGERVLTASEARNYDGGSAGAVQVTGNTFVVRQDSDIDDIAAALVEKIRQARMAGVS